MKSAAELAACQLVGGRGARLVAENSSGTGAPYRQAERAFRISRLAERDEISGCDLAAAVVFPPEPPHRADDELHARLLVEQYPPRPHLGDVAERDARRHGRREGLAAQAARDAQGQLAQ